MTNRTVVVSISDDEFLHSVDKVIHHFKVAVLQFLAVSHRRQKVVEDGDEEVHDHDNHGEKVEHEEKTGSHSAVSHHRVQTELSQHSFHLWSA